MTASRLVAPGTTPRPRTRRPSAAALRRRHQFRRSAALVLLVLGLLVGAGSAAGYGLGQAADAVRAAWPEPAPDLAADKAAPPEPLDPAGPADTCGPDMVSLQLGSSSSTLVLGDSVPFAMRVTNIGPVPCLLDGHRSSMQVTVTGPDGDERVWSSADCAGSDEELLLLGPDEVWESASSWTGARSKPGCESSGKKVPAGEYTATMSLADVGVDSEPYAVTVEAAPAPEPSQDPQDPKGSAEEGGSGKGGSGKDAGDRADTQDDKDQSAKEKADKGTRNKGAKDGNGDQG